MLVYLFLMLAMVFTYNNSIKSNQGAEEDDVFELTIYAFAGVFMFTQTMLVSLYLYNVILGTYLTVFLAVIEIMAPSAVFALILFFQCKLSGIPYDSV